MDSPKENGSTAVQVSSNGFSPPDSDDKLPVVHQEEDPQKWPAGKNAQRGGRVRRCLCENLLTLVTLLGVMVGIGLGFVLRYFKTWSDREIMYVNFPGEVFLNMLKCLILPLIVSSLVAAIGSLDTKISGKIGIRAVAYYILTTVLAIILGIILVVTIRPGAGNPENFPKTEIQEAKPTLPEDTLMDLVRNMFPPNIMEATMTQFATVLEIPKNWTKPNNETTNEEMKAWKLSQEPRQQINILGVVVFSVVVGITLAKMKRKGKPLLEVFICLSEAMMIITKVVIWLSPVGILFLVASKIMEMEDLSVIVGQIGYYTLTVLAGIFLHGFVVLPLIYFLFVRKNPITFVLNMGQALATAFGTSSSSATLPVTIACLEEKNGIDPRVSRFCLPIGATINMDGTALYEAVAAIFIAQVRGRDLSLGNIVAISITSTAASIGAAGIPQAGLVTMVMVLNVVGLPAEDVTLILIVDWILDRFRTVVNVLGDAFGAAIVGHMSEKDLAEIPDNLSNNLEMTTL